LDDLKLKNSKDAKDHLISYLSKEELAFEYGDGSQDPVIEEDPNFQISHLMPEEDDMDEDEEGLEEPQLEFFPDIDPIFRMMGNSGPGERQDSSQMNTSGTAPFLLQLMQDVNLSSSEDGNMSLPPNHFEQAEV
jgi:hypothetical protein